MAGPLLQNPDDMERLRQKLEACPWVAKSGPEEAATLVHAFSDIETSCRRFLEKHLPALVDPDVVGERLEDLLIDIQMEFQHILYHIHDPEFFRVVEPTHDWLTLTSDIDHGAPPA
jgi:hypothetical protein